MQLNRSNPSAVQEFSKTKRLNQIKSQKNLISQNYIEENTEENNDGHNEQGRRQTEMENIEMRQTYGRPKMLKKSKLPWHPKVRPVIKEHRQDSLKFMIENNQYKQAQGFLPPIPIEEKEKKQNFSPYNMIAKFDNFRNEFNNILERDKSDLLQEGKKSYKAILGSKYRPEQFINLEIIKSAHHTGVIKKVIHLPNFKLYAAKEEPINNKQTLYSLKEWLLFWQSKANQDDDSPFIKIINIDWNNPQGFVTVTTEYMVEGSLESLLESVGTLPQNAIQEICHPILKALMKFYNLLEGGYGSLSPSQIMFGNNLQIKLGFGLGCRGVATNSTIYSIKPPTPKHNIFNVDEQNIWSKTNSRNNQMERSYDIFKFGLILLRASAGNFEMFSQSTGIFESLKELLTQNGQKTVQRLDLCCVIHSQKQILDLQLHQKHNENQQGDTQIPFQFITFLKERYSSTFIHFLCMCLQLSNKKRSTIHDLINYTFVKTKPSQSLIKVTLEDLHKITKPSIDLQGSKYHKKLDLIVKSVQSNVRQGKFELLPDFKGITKAKVVELAQDLQIPQQMLENKINEWKKYNSTF